MTFHIIMWSCKIYTNLWSYQCCEFTLFKWCIFIQNFSEKRICIMRYLISYSLRTFTVLFNIFFKRKVLCTYRALQKANTTQLAKKHYLIFTKSNEGLQNMSAIQFIFLNYRLNWNILLQTHWPNCYFSIKALLSAILSVSW